MPTALTTRITTGTGATVKNAPLTSTEIDNNFLSLNDNKLETTFTGSSNIVTVGTVTTGTWSATTIALNKGGTGATSASGARTNLELGTSNAVQLGSLGIGAAAPTNVANSVGITGALGIGTSGPAGDFRLLVYWDSSSASITGGITFADVATTGTGNQIRFTKNSVATGAIQSNNTNVNYITGTGNGLYGVDASSMALYSNSVERLRFSSAGGMGLSGANYGTSGQLLQSNGNTPPTWVTPAFATTGKAIAMAMVFGG
jgi:hypothetical protein